MEVSDLGKGETQPSGRAAEREGFERSRTLHH